MFDTLSRLFARSAFFPPSEAEFSSERAKHRYLHLFPFAIPALLLFAILSYNLCAWLHTTLREAGVGPPLQAPIYTAWGLCVDLFFLLIICALQCKNARLVRRTRGGYRFRVVSAVLAVALLPVAWLLYLTNPFEGCLELPYTLFSVYPLFQLLRNLVICVLTRRHKERLARKRAEAGLPAAPGDGGYPLFPVAPPRGSRFRTAWGARLYTLLFSGVYLFLLLGVPLIAHILMAIDSGLDFIGALSLFSPMLSLYWLIFPPFFLLPAIAAVVCTHQITNAYLLRHVQGAFLFRTLSALLPALPPVALFAVLLATSSFEATAAVSLLVIPYLLLQATREAILLGLDSKKRKKKRTYKEEDAV